MARHEEDGSVTTITVAVAASAMEIADGSDGPGDRPSVTKRLGTALWPLLALAAVALFGAGFAAGLTASWGRPTTQLDWRGGSSPLHQNLQTVVQSDNYCTRRSAMARAAGLAAGLSAAVVDDPAYSAETAEVKMGADSGMLVFVPAKLEICAGDSVKWINNRGGPHNVDFDEDMIPAGIDVEAISMWDYHLGEEGSTYTVKFTVAGTYEYYCEPHRGAGMMGSIVVG